MVSCANVFAQIESKNDKTIVGYPKSFGESKPISELFVKNESETAKVTLKESGDKKNRKPPEYLYSPKDGAKYANDESTVQRSQGLKALSAPIQNWAGQSAGGSCPLDPSGAMGMKYYVQAINASPFKIFNKTNGAAVGTVKDIGSLWNPPTSDEGDPIVLYDKYADRWLITQFGKPDIIYFAISKTGDPAGSYYTYTFDVGDEFPDYFKISIWQDGYYMTSNGTSFVNVFEREKMLVGDSKARVLTKAVTPPFKGFWCPLPADADGVLPPANSPCPLIYFTDNNLNNKFTDAIVIQNMTTVWTGTPSLSVSAPISIPVAAFDSKYKSSFEDVDQGVGTQKIDAVGGAIMYRSQWRKWTGYNTLLACWAVKMKEGVYNTKWVELRQDQTTNTWSLYQEGVYAPDDLSRWIASMAMDDNGSIAMAYAVTGKSPATSPGLRYTGRLKNDPLGKMTFAEEVAVNGAGTTNCGERIGDYAQTSLDPQDGLTFWHTGMYANNGAKSRIYSFKLPTTTLGVDEFNKDAVFNIYQNLSDLKIVASQLESDKDLIVNLFDLNGKQIFQKTIKSSSSFDTSFDVSNLSKGIYLVRVGNVDFQKVVKVSIK